MNLDINQKAGLIQLISFVISERINDEATDLSYTELLNLKNILREEEPEEEEPTYALREDGIEVVGSHKVVLNERIQQEEMHEYSIIDRKDFIDELIRWISEARSTDKEMMKQDLFMLQEWKDDYILSSNSTNSYIRQGDSGFDEACKELIELNEGL